MTETYQLLLRHGYVIIFFAALGERIGFPLLLTPFLVAAGAFAAYGRMSLTPPIALTTVAFVIGDLLWYELGRWRGSQVLRLLCRLSLQPDSCVRYSQQFMGRHGPYSLLYSKFVPGVGRVVPPLAGTTGMPLAKFAVLSAAGSLVWAVVMALIGYFPARPLSHTQVAQAVLVWGIGLGILAVLVNVAWKYVRRQQLLHELRMARVTPEEVQQMLERGEPLAIVDLRHGLDSIHDPRVLPGALRIKPEEIVCRVAELPGDRDLILYCT